MVEIEQTEQTEQEVIFDTEICKNQDETKFEEDFGINPYECSHIFIPENCRKENRKRLTAELIEEIQNEIGKIKSKNPEKIVLGFFQTKKNTIKTRNRVIKQISCSSFDGSDGACIYETNIQQEPEDFEDELYDFLKFTGNLEKYLVFEIESNKIKEKLEIAINNGLRNFILIAGKYNDNDLWTDLVDRVRAEMNGKIAIILSKRMHKITKKSYMEQAINSGVNIVCHGKFVGGSDEKKKRINLFLDGNDMVYKEPDNLPATNVLRSDRTFVDLFNTNRGHLDNEYSVSRISALREGNIYSETHKRTIILNARNSNLSS